MQNTYFDPNQPAHRHPSAAEAPSQMPLSAQSSHPSPQTHQPQQQHALNTSNSGGASSAAAAAAAVGAEAMRPRFIHNGAVCSYNGSIFDKLLDPALYTGAHKHRFGPDGRGRGIAGRDSHSAAASILHFRSKSGGSGSRASHNSSGGASRQRGSSASHSGGGAYEYKQQQQQQEASDARGAVWARSLRRGGSAHHSAAHAALTRDGHCAALYRDTSRLGGVGVGMGGGGGAAAGPPTMEGGGAGNEATPQRQQQQHRSQQRQQPPSATRAADARIFAAAAAAAPPAPFSPHQLQDSHRVTGLPGAPADSPTKLLRSHRWGPPTTSPAADPKEVRRYVEEADEEDVDGSYHAHAQAPIVVKYARADLSAFVNNNSMPQGAVAAYPSGIMGGQSRSHSHAEMSVGGEEWGHRMHSNGVAAEKDGVRAPAMATHDGQSPAPRRTQQRGYEYEFEEKKSPSNSSGGKQRAAPILLSESDPTAAYAASIRGTSPGELPFAAGPSPQKAVRSVSGGSVTAPQQLQRKAQQPQQQQQHRSITNVYDSVAGRGQAADAFADEGSILLMRGHSTRGERDTPHSHPSAAAHPRSTSTPILEGLESSGAARSHQLTASGGGGGRAAVTDSGLWRASTAVSMGAPTAVAFAIATTARHEGSGGGNSTEQNKTGLTTTNNNSAEQHEQITSAKGAAAAGEEEEDDAALASRLASVLAQLQQRGIHLTVAPTAATASLPPQAPPTSTQEDAATVASIGTADYPSAVAPQPSSAGLTTVREERFGVAPSHLAGYDRRDRGGSAAGNDGKNNATPAAVGAAAPSAATCTVSAPSASAAAGRLHATASSTSTSQLRVAMAAAESLRQEQEAGGDVLVAATAGWAGARGQGARERWAAEDAPPPAAPHRPPPPMRTASHFVAAARGDATPLREGGGGGGGVQDAHGMYPLAFSPKPKIAASAEAPFLLSTPPPRHAASPAEAEGAPHAAPYTHAYLSTYAAAEAEGAAVPSLQRYERNNVVTNVAAAAAARPPPTSASDGRGVALGEGMRGYTAFGSLGEEGAVAGGLRSNSQRSAVESHRSSLGARRVDSYETMVRH